MVTLASKTKRSIAYIVLGLLILAVGGLLGYRIAYTHLTQTTQRLITGIHSVRENNESYHFIYPLLLYSFGEAKKFLIDQQLQKSLEDYTNSQYANNNAQDISVVVRGFPDGKLVELKSDDKYHPGSMLKVIILMGYFRRVETDPGLLQKPLTYTLAVDQAANSLQYGLASNLKVGQNYTVEQLLQSMIDDSDNGAAELLLQNVNPTILNQAYVDLGIPVPGADSSNYTLSAAQYSGFLRILYNSTYLTEQYSDRALSIMSHSTYQDGIVAGVPAGTVVAHKYGERIDNPDGANKTVELHDCGIVYAANHPYVICVMTKGTDIKKLTGIIKDISAMVYKHNE